MPNSHLSRPFARVAIGAALLCATGLAAANQCRGVAENACAADSACTWVGSYTRKDGLTVNGYCRQRSDRKSEQTASAAGTDGR